MPTFEELFERKKLELDKELEATAAEELRSRAAEELRSRPIPELSIDSILSKGYLEETPQDIDFLLSIPVEQLSKLPLRTQAKIEAVLKCAINAYDEIIASRTRLRPRLKEAKKLLENLDAQPSDSPSDTQEILSILP